MSLKEKLFGSRKSKHQKILTPQEAIQQLRESKEKLKDKSDFLEKEIEKELNIAKQNISNKKVAKAALKRKKRHKKTLQQIDTTLKTIESKREALENGTKDNRVTSTAPKRKKGHQIDPSTNPNVLQAMGSAASALKSAHSNFDVDKVHDLMDDVTEQLQIAQELSDGISKPVGFEDMDDMDEDEAQAELEKLEQEDLNKKLLNVGEPTAELPPVPTERSSVAAAETKAVEDDDAQAR